MKRLTAALAALILAFPASARAQSSVLQGGPWTQGHPLMYSSPSSFGEPVVQDPGPAGGGLAGQGLSEILQTNQGTGSAPYAGTGTGPLGTHDCHYDGPITGPYHYLCFDANANGGGLILYGAAGGASAIPLYLNINGSQIPIQIGLGGGNVTGPVSSTVGHLATWGNALGTSLVDSPISSSALAAVALPLYSTTPATGALLTGHDIGGTGVPAALLNPLYSTTPATGALLTGHDIGGAGVTTVLTTATNATGGIMPQPSPWVAGNSVKVGGSGGVADAGYVAMSSTFPTGVSGTVNSGGIPYFNSTLQMSSSGALTQNGVVYGGGAGAAPNATAAGSLGQLLVGTAGAPAFKTPATYSSVGLSNPTGTTNTTGVMMGLGAQGASITPTFSGRVLLIYTGILASNSGTAYTHIVYTYYGTGGAPANGAALTGTQVNSQGPNFNSSVNMGISVIGVVTGLAVGTTYWLDIALKSGNSGATINAYYNNIQAIEF